MSLSQAQVITPSSYLDEINNTVFLSWCKCYLAVVMCTATRYFYYCYNYHHFYFLGRLPKVDLIILEGEKMSVHPSVHKKFLQFQ